MDNFDINDIDRFRNCSLIREDRILGNAHLNVAIRYVKENFETGRSISKSIWNEILLYLSLQRQVHKAFEIVGVKDYSGPIIKVENSSGRESLPVIEATEAKKRYWNVRSVEELLERMALFHIENY
ncbi:MAG: KEOPS complex subunit Cgi121 [Thermoplasmata archaeon]